MSFWCFEFFLKTNENNSTWGIIAVKAFFFFFFLEEFKTPKRHFEVNWPLVSLLKVNSVQEACAKCFAVLILKFEILQITWKKWNKKHQTLSFAFFTNRFSFLMLVFVLFFMWFVRFQILISEPQIIWQKLLVLSWL